MDSDVMDALHELGCFSAAPIGFIDEIADSPADITENDPIDDLWTDLGGEG